MKILLTGASGFIGSAAFARLQPRAGVSLAVVSRNPSKLADQLDLSAHPVILGCDLSTQTDWSSILKKVEVVIHLGNRAHVLDKSSLESLVEFRRVNVDVTLNLAEASIRAGVRRFIFVSSIGVNGAETFDKLFSENDLPAPHAHYALSKFEAEEGLRDLVAGSEMELVIIRPPLVYGADAPGNFGMLLRLVDSGLPCPLASIENRRSFIALENLVDFIITCIEHPKAANELFVISDGEDISTPQMIRFLAEGMNRNSRLWHFPPALLEFGARMIGRKSMYQQLCGSMRIDSSKARELLGWKPVVSVDEGLRQAGREYKERLRGEGTAPTGAAPTGYKPGKSGDG